MIARVNHARFSLHLREPLFSGAGPITRRKGILLALCDEDGRTGFGEISPLPGLHRESIAEVEGVLPDVAPRTSVEASVGRCRYIPGTSLPSPHPS